MEHFEKLIAQAAPSTAHLRAWPSLTQAAELLGMGLPTLTRALDARGVTKHPLGARTKKVAPVDVLDLCLDYGADTAEVAARLVELAMSAGVEPRYVQSVEDDLGSWFAGRARSAPARAADDIEALMQAVRAVADPDVADAILARAGLTGGAADARLRRRASRRR